MNREDLYQLLQTALREPHRRWESIKRFQDAIFEGSQGRLGLSEGEWDVFTQLAQDLDYYEPDPEMRREDPTFYGDERVIEEIREALAKLHLQA